MLQWGLQEFFYQASVFLISQSCAWFFFSLNFSDISPFSWRGVQTPIQKGMEKWEENILWKSSVKGLFLAKLWPFSEQLEQKTYLFIFQGLCKSSSLQAKFVLQSTVIFKIKLFFKYNDTLIKLLYNESCLNTIYCHKLYVFTKGLPRSWMEQVVMSVNFA